MTVDLDHWDYRLVREEGEGRPGERYVEVCEMFYDTDGVPVGYVPRAPGAESVEELESVLSGMRAAATKTVIKMVGGQLFDTGKVLS